MSSPYREIEDNISYLMGRPDASSIDRTDLTSEIEEIAHRLNAHNTAIERVEFIMGTSYIGFVVIHTLTNMHTYIHTCIPYWSLTH